MADLNYNVPDEIAMAFKEYCENEGLTQRVAVQWACYKFMQLDLEERRKLIDSYREWVSKTGGKEAAQIPAASQRKQKSA